MIIIIIVIIIYSLERQDTMYLIESCRSLLTVTFVLWLMTSLNPLVPVRCISSGISCINS